jgi:hypothetical protein
MLESVMIVAVEGFESTPVLHNSLELVVHIVVLHGIDDTCADKVIS